MMFYYVVAIMTDGCQAYYFSYLIFRQFLVYILALIVLDELMSLQQACLWWHLQGCFGQIFRLIKLLYKVFCSSFNNCCDEAHFF